MLLEEYFHVSVIVEIGIDIFRRWKFIEKIVFLLPDSIRNNA